MGSRSQTVWRGRLMSLRCRHKEAYELLLWSRRTDLGAEGYQRKRRPPCLGRSCCAVVSAAHPRSVRARRSARPLRSDRPEAERAHSVVRRTDAFPSVDPYSSEATRCAAPHENSDQMTGEPAASPPAATPPKPATPCPTLSDHNRNEFPLTRAARAWGRWCVMKRHTTPFISLPAPENGGVDHAHG